MLRQLNNVIGLLNCDKKRMMDVDLEPALNVFGPYCFNLVSAVDCDKPLSVHESEPSTCSFFSAQKFSNGEDVCSWFFILYSFVIFFCMRLF